MASKTRAANAAVDGESPIAIGGGPGDSIFYANPTAFEVPNVQAVKEIPVKARGYQPLPVPDPNALPFAAVARVHAGREIQRLRAQAEGIERELSRGVLGASGMVAPHLVERQDANRTALDEIRAEIERIEAMDDNAVRVWAFEHGYR